MITPYISAARFAACEAEWPSPAISAKTEPSCLEASENPGKGALHDQSASRPAAQWAYRSAGQLVESLQQREVSALELTDLFIARIEALDGDLNAMPVRDFARAREAAKEADAALARGERQPLLGVPVTIKESYNIAGLPTTWGIPAFKDFVPPEDALAVSRLKAAGAIVLGKTNVPLSLGDWQSYNDIYGATNNPWDKGRRRAALRAGRPRRWPRVSALCRSAATSAAHCAFQPISAGFARISRPMNSSPRAAICRRACPPGWRGGTWPSSARWRVASTTFLSRSISSPVRTRLPTGAPTVSAYRRRGPRNFRITAFSSSPNIRFCRPRRQSALRSTACQNSFKPRAPPSDTRRRFSRISGRRPSCTSSSSTPSFRRECRTTGIRKCGARRRRFPPMTRAWWRNLCVGRCSAIGNGFGPISRARG